MEARRLGLITPKIEAALPEAVSIPHAVYAFKPGWVACTVYGVLWSMQKGKPGSLTINPAAIALLLCCDVRTVTEGLTKLEAFGLVDNPSPRGGKRPWANIYVHDATAIAVQRRIVDDPQRTLLPDDEPERSEVPAQKPPKPMLHEHEITKSLPCSMSMGSEDSARKSPTVDVEAVALAAYIEQRRRKAWQREPETIGGVFNAARLAAELADGVNDPQCHRALFDDVAAAVASGGLAADRVRGLVGELNRRQREGRPVRSRGAWFRSEVKKLLAGDVPRLPR